MTGDQFFLAFFHLLVLQNDLQLNNYT
jgi:hypothetical protein